MKRAVVLTLALLLQPASAGTVEHVSWSSPDRPTLGPARAIGGYARGCVGGAVALPAEGPGYQVLRLERNRYYGHPSLIRFVEDLGRKARARGMGTLLIGDLAQPRGGPMAFGHGSHQSGLDADIWFRLATRPLSAIEREQPTAVSMVDADGSTSPAWTERQARLLALAAAAPEVERIFVNPAVKRALCRRDGADRAWLHKLRPWRGHDEHFHVRLRCPADSPKCQPQAPIPSGDGCNEAESWLNAGALLEAQFKPPAEPPQRLPPPSACSAILHPSQ